MADQVHHCTSYSSFITKLRCLVDCTAVPIALCFRPHSAVPGALHQCENTNIVFFDTGGARPLDVLFLPSSAVPDSLRSGTTTLDQALSYSPLLAIDGIPTADAASYPFELQIAEGTVFEVRRPTISRRVRTLFADCDPP